MSETPSQSSASVRPPGGTSRTGGRGPNKIPRRVQWIDDLSEDPNSADSPKHILDEYGMDMNAFERLTDSLEQHKREKVAPLSEVRYYQPEPDTGSSSSSEEHLDEHVVSEAAPSDSYFTMSPPASSAVDIHSEVESSGPSSPIHQIPDNYIDPEENAGLPGTRDLRKYSQMKAKKIVSSHLHQNSMRRPSRSGGMRDAHVPDEQQDDTSHESIPMSQFVDSRGRGDDTDIEEGMEPNIGRPTTSGGLLSAILSLYDNETRPSSAKSSIISSGDDSTRGLMSTDVSEDESTPRRSPLSPRRLSTVSSVSGESTTSKEGTKRSRKPKHRIKLPESLVSRPPAARSSAGVFGPLITATGNLTGMAAPIPSQLQPDVQSTGYRLSRYVPKHKPSVSEPPPVRTADRPSGSSEFKEPERFVPQSPSAAPPSTPTQPHAIYGAGHKSNWSGMLGSFSSLPTFKLPGRSPHASAPSTPDEERKRYVQERKERRHKRKKAEVYITRHVAKIIQREEFIMKLTRAMMMFGAPSHRLQAQMQSAARVLDIELSLLYLPGIVLLSFDDNSTGTSHIKLIRQASALDLGKLDDAYKLYWKVIHDKLSVSVASKELDVLMRKPPLYNWWKSLIIGGMCSSAICTISFSGSFIDALICFPMGAMLVAVQILSGRNILYSYVFEVTITTLFSFIAAALAASHHLCYSAIASSSIVLILPGFLVLTGSLELMSRHVVAGSVHLCYAVVYALFLGFGFAIGAELYELFTKSKVYGAVDYSCLLTHNQSGPWYQRTPTKWWAFLTVPMYSTFLSLRNQMPWHKKELLLLVAIASIGWVTNYFVATKFVDQSDITAAVGAFAVGLVANIYARFFRGNAFVIMITGILFQLPSGLGNGGLLNYASEQTAGSSQSYISGFKTALKLVSVAIGLAIGLGLSLSLSHPIQSKKREAGIFSL